ncbi:hypothetical protein R5W24_000292 [Gemmata sp. JC717]|uniref:TlpA family protein disulfide reductase n=1 Tax=Gemmata algarum TaxID=2975278 RepID=UPI0021BABD47|nr:hypothetical protein [Gemmata algarum]MDY3551217.1 hypothetical protein [Gemmata algarum]
MTAVLLTLALSPAAPPEAPGLQPGAELTFVGKVEEAVERPGTRFLRTQALEVRVLVLEKQDAWVDAAVLTLLRRGNDAVTGAVGAVTGDTVEKAAPPAVRLDLVRVHADGTVHHLQPTGVPPFTLDARTPARAPPAIRLDAFTPFEFGMFPPRPPRTDPEKAWTRAAADPSRPAEVWQLQGTKVVTGERCAVLVANQQHSNWDKPVGGRTAWHRADEVCVAPDGTARQVHRVIRHRDGTDTALAAWVEVKYELKEQAPVAGRTRDRYRRDIETALAAGAELAPFLADPVRHGPRFFETKGAKLDAYLDSADESSPYREAVLAVRRQVTAAARGESVLAAGPLAVPVKRSPWPEPNRPAPDFTAGRFRLSEGRGQPAFLVFFKPGSETTDLALAIADALHRKHGPRAAIVPLAVWGDPADGPRERARLKLTVPVYDGEQADTSYGVDSVPRFALVDAHGVVRWTFCGVGDETGAEALAQLERLLKPASPVGATGTIGGAAPAAAGSVPRP